MMITLKNIETYITDDILNQLFLERKNKIHDIEKQKQILANDREYSEKLEIALNNLPNCFEETSKRIRKSVEEKIQSQNEILTLLSEITLKIQQEKDILELYKKQKAYLLKNMFI